MKQDTAAARVVALAALNNVERRQAYSGPALLGETRKHSLSPREERLVWKLVYGVITYRLSLDYVLNKFCRQNVSRLSTTMRNIMRLACYQLVYLDRIPDFAAVNEAVAMARRSSGQRMAGFVNGVLRNIVRQRDSLFDLSPHSAEGISVLHSHPLWMVEKWLKKWGAEFTADLCRANNLPASLTIRVNTGKISVEDYFTLTAEKGLSPIRGKYCREALLFPANTKFSDLPGFSQGLFIVQGEASMLVADCLDLRPGQKVLDMCSAPGGKATHIASRIEAGEVTACDLHAGRVKLVEENAARLGLDNVKALKADARKLPEYLRARFDRVLVDAPCTGLGVIRKKPDIKWARQPEDLDVLAALQQEILRTGCQLLRPGGYLVYSTCTIMDEENQDNVHSLLAARNEMKLERLEISNLSGREGVINTFPHLHDLDGFFIAKFKKVE